MPYPTKTLVDSILDMLLSCFKIDYSSKYKYFEDAINQKIQQGEEDITLSFDDKSFHDVRLIKESCYDNLDEDYDDKPKAEYSTYGYYIILKNGKEYNSKPDTVRHADLIIADLLAHSGIDYSPKRRKIEQNYDNELMRGYWDSSISFEDEKYPDIRLIQEDEYDQHMDDDEKPDYDLFVDGYYVIIEN